MPHMKMKRKWQLWVGLAISAAALALALLGIDLRQVVETLAQAEYIYLLPVTAGMLAYLASRAVRWRLLLGPGVSLSQCFWVTAIGYLVSNVLPFRLGDPARRRVGPARLPDPGPRHPVRLRQATRPVASGS